MPDLESIQEFEEVESLSMPRVLVVDDDSANRMVLRTFLLKEGYQVDEASDGLQAVEYCQHTMPDMIFMDLAMPNMDGYEATRRIKALAGDEFAGIIVLTAFSEADALMRAIEAGADDYLTKPISFGRLKAKMLVMMRIRAMHESMRKLHKERMRELDMAEQLFNHVILAGDESHSHPETLKVHLQAAESFCSDLILAHRHPSGQLFVLHGDLSGQGVSAALGTLPVLARFRGLVEQGYEARRLLKALNQLMCDLLPAQIYMKASLIIIEPDGQSVQFWNAGMEEVWLLGAEGVRGFPSRNLPLGMSQTDLSYHFEQIHLNPGERLLFTSDGVRECENAKGQIFGRQRLLTWLAERAQQESQTSLLVPLMDTLTDWSQGVALIDDISLLELKSGTPLAERHAQEIAPLAKPAALLWTFRGEGDTLASIDPVPQVMTMLDTLLPYPQVRHDLFLIMRELYNLALEQGLLGLDYQQKHDEEGLALYYEAREQGLADLQNGRVDLKVWLNEGKRLILEVACEGGCADRLDIQEEALIRLKRHASRVHLQDQGRRMQAVYELTST
ncbi:Stage II sporulation protein E (SpoIIE) [Allopseudospirillum japonicum]|uniref:histidine kinase n=1 Tax=Allopseudospirillum japonicum TaxID=64971 RepID=A0A1H6SDR7_9GAMM|nr:SpoIIE family protein phosphatase [Allopseudospirillum japonicum]SEI64956.1 Stage II sporulation protein E (SpoIIE) [Allopseudospirillum japonicum]